MRIDPPCEPSGAIAGFLTDTGAHYYPLTDHLGSILYTVDNTGNPASGATYQPFGAQTITTPAPFTQPFGYTGAYTQPATGLIHLSARYYDPALGRFTQQDPSGQDANPYTYAGNDPINHIDPNGLDFWSAAAGVIVAGIAGIGVAAVFAGNPVAVGIAVGATCGAVDSMSSGGDLENISPKRSPELSSAVWEEWDDNRLGRQPH